MGFWSVSRWTISNACLMMRTAISFLPLLRPCIISESVILQSHHVAVSIVNIARVEVLRMLRCFNLSGMVWLFYCRSGIPSMKQVFAMGSHIRDTSG